MPCPCLSPSHRTTHCTNCTRWWQGDTSLPSSSMRKRSWEWVLQPRGWPGTNHGRYTWRGTSIFLALLWSLVNPRHTDPARSFHRWPHVCATFEIYHSTVAKVWSFAAPAGVGHRATPDDSDWTWWFRDYLSSILSASNCCCKEIKFATPYTMSQSEWFLTRYLNPYSLVCMQEFVSEAVIWSHLRHENIVPFIGVVERDHSLWLVSKFMVGGNVKTYIQNRGRHNCDLRHLVRYFT